MKSALALTGKAAPPGGATSPRLRPVPAVSRSIAILRLLGASEVALGVKAIAQELGLVTSTCLHILRVLVQEDLVRVDPLTKRYTLGTGMLPLARSVIERNTFPNVAQPVLDALAASWGVTAMGVEVRGLDHLVVVALSRSQVPFSLHVDVGSRFPALTSATGRLVAAFSGRPWQDIAQAFRLVHWQNAPRIEVWRKEVEAAGRKGFSIDRGNYVNGVTIVAVPLLNAAGQVSHALVAAGVSAQRDVARSVALAAAMRAQAQAISDSIAARG
jgi:DNA-binding IclR family transcriptional regulator